MFIFEKRTQIPVCIKNRNPRLAGIILSQYGGPDGELGASLRYLSQRFTMPDNMGKGLLTDIGTEELAHLEIVGSIVGQLTDGEGARSFDKYGTGAYYVNHSNAVYPANANGMPFTAAYLQSMGDPIADLTEDLAAEQKARATYDNILRLSDDPDVNEVIKFLRAREVVHFQRFGDAKHTILSKSSPTLLINPLKYKTQSAIMFAELKFHKGAFSHDKANNFNNFGADKSCNIYSGLCTAERCILAALRELRYGLRRSKFKVEF